MALRYMYTLVLLVLQLMLLEAQTIPFRLYTVQDGLPQSQILTIFQDSRGYLWVGTYGGLAYFDGQTFHTLRANDGLPYTVITKIDEDRQGNIIFRASKWLCRYNGQYIKADTLQIPLLHDYVLDAEKIMWAIHGANQELYFSHDYKTWLPAASRWPVLQNRKWKRVYYDHTRRRLLLLDNNLNVFHDGVIAPLSSELPLEKFIYNIQSANLLFKGDTILLVGKQGVHLFPERMQSKIGLAEIMTDSTILYAEQAGTKMTSLLVRRKGKTLSCPLGVPISKIFVDKDDNVWLATENGLARVFIKGFLNISRDTLESVWSMVEDAEGRMWFGEYFTKRLKRFDGNKFSEFSISYAIHPTLPKGVLGDFYFGGARDSKGNLYFPSSLGIKKYDGKRFTLLDKPGSKHTVDPLSLNFYLDSARQCIISGTLGGLSVIQLKTGEKEYFSAESGLSRPYNMLGVAKDARGLYWLGMGQGLAVFDLDQKRYTAEYSSGKNNFPFYMISAVASDHKGNIWAGSAKGLVWRDIENDSFAHIAPQTIRSHITSLANWKNKYLVIGSIEGIYLLDLVLFYESGTTAVRQFNQHNGYTGIEPNQNCQYIDSKDYVWISASDIVTRIAPSELNMSPQRLSVYITEINNERIAYSDYNRVKVLPKGINTIKVRFEAVGFERPAKAEFSYKIDEEPWSEWYNEDFLVLDNLSSGTYLLKVRTRPAGTVGPESIGEAQISLVVSAPLFKEWWFPYFVTFCVSLLVGLSLFYLGRLRNKAKKEAEAYTSYMATQEKLNEERGRLIKYLQIHTLQAQLNPHFIFNVLQVIQTKIYEGSREVAAALIVDLGHLIRRFLESSIGMDVSRSGNSEITVAQEISLLRSYIEFEQLQFSKRFDYEIHIAGDLDVENVYVPPMLVQPYVENAIKHGILYAPEQYSRLDIYFVKTPKEKLQITVADTGVGRDEAKKIQERFIKMYKSRGTQILEDRIRIMQELGHAIQVKVENNPVGGTIVVLTIDM